jgi:hypothetical protein
MQIYNFPRNISWRGLFLPLCVFGTPSSAQDTTTGLLASL